MLSNVKMGRLTYLNLDCPGRPSIMKSGRGREKRVREGDVMMDTEFRVMQCTMQCRSLPPGLV